MHRFRYHFPELTKLTSAQLGNVDHGAKCVILEYLYAFLNAGKHN